MVAMIKEPLSKIFETALETLGPLLAKREDAMFLKNRFTALSYFKKYGMPSKQQDDWKYTDLSRYHFENFLTPPEPSHTSSLNKIHPLLIDPLSTQQFISYNGYAIQTFKPAHFDIQTRPLSGVEDPPKNGLEALNRAFYMDTASIVIPRNCEVKEPIYLFHVIDSDQNTFMVQPKNWITLEENSQATLIEIYFSLGENPSFNNIVTEIRLAKNARLNHLFVQRSLTQNLQIAHINVQQAEASDYTTTALLLGGALNRTNFQIDLNQAHAHSQFYALALANAKQQSDLHLCIRHNQPDCQSHTLTRGLVADHARSAFTGKIVVQEGASRSQATLENKNLLLSSEAEVDTRPQLEIYNDDVQCSHGATVGHLDLEALFYLKSRGIPEQEAKKLLIKAFMGPSLEGIPLPLRKAVEDLIDAH